MPEIGEETVVTLWIGGKQLPVVFEWTGQAWVNKDEVVVKKGTLEAYIGGGIMGRPMRLDE